MMGMLYHNRESGVGSGEWGTGRDTTPGVDHRFGPSEAPDRKLGSGGSIFPPLPIPHSPHPASIFVLAAGADFIEKPDASLGLIKDLLQRVAGRRVAVLLAYFDRGALPFGHVAVVLDQLLDHFVGRHVVVVVVRD